MYVILVRNRLQIFFVPMKLHIVCARTIINVQIQIKIYRTTPSIPTYTLWKIVLIPCTNHFSYRPKMSLNRTFMIHAMIQWGGLTGYGFWVWSVQPGI